MAKNTENQNTAASQNEPQGEDLAAELAAMKAELAEFRDQRRQKRESRMMGNNADDQPVDNTQDKMVDAVETVLHHLQKDFFRDPPLAALGVAIVSGMATKMLLARRQTIKRKVLNRDDSVDLG